MTTITLEIPKEIKEKLGIGQNVSYDFLISKTIGREYISPDLGFINYSDMTDSHKGEYNKLDDINKDKLLNI